jgi:hypothetical protein
MIIKTLFLVSGHGTPEMGNDAPEMGNGAAQKLWVHKQQRSIGLWSNRLWFTHRAGRPMGGHARVAQPSGDPWTSRRTCGPFCLIPRLVGSQYQLRRLARASNRDPSVNTNRAKPSTCRQR